MENLTRSYTPGQGPRLHMNGIKQLSEYSRRQDFELVDEVIEDVRLKHTQGTQCRPETLFYYAVRGGNVGLVREVLAVLGRPEHASMRRWLLGGASAGQSEGPSSYIMKERVPRTRCQRLAMFAWFIILGLLYILLTPVFYICHFAMSALWLHVCSKPSASPTLPLALVCKSRSEEMIRLFHHGGLDVEETDENGSNIIHHLASLSGEDHQGALHMWDSLRAVYTRADFTRLCLSTNNTGLSPLEMAVKMGSVSFLCHVMESRGPFNSTKLHINREFAFINNSQTVSDPYVMNEANQSRYSATEKSPHNGIRITQIDVSEYESGDTLCNQSLLLRMISQRDSAKVKVKDLHCLLKNSVISAWINKKFSMLWFPRLFSTLYGITLSLLVLLYLIQTGGDSIQEPLSNIIYSKYVRYLEEYSHLDLQVILKMTMSDVQVHCLYEVSNGSGTYDDWCYNQAMDDVLAQCKYQVTREDVRRNTGFYEKVDSSDMQTIRPVLIAMMSLYILTDLVARLVFLWKNLWCNTFNTKVMSGVGRVICHGLPGSYLHKQLNVLSCGLFLTGLAFNAFVYRPLEDRTRTGLSDTRKVNEFLEYYERLEYYETLYSYISVLSLLLRLLCVIHSLRLLPSIGHFVIVTFKMAETLAQFLVVYALILVAFGTIFHFLLRDPTCPALRYADYDDVLKSAYQAFLMALGMADLPPEHRLLTKIAHVTFLLLSAIVLMNMIIGVMTIVVEEISCKPQKPVSYLMEHLADALSAEAVWQILTSPVSFRVNKWLLRRSGFVLQETNLSADPSSRTTYSVYLQTVQETMTASED